MRAAQVSEIPEISARQLVGVSEKRVAEAVDSPGSGLRFADFGKTVLLRPAWQEVEKLVIELLGTLPDRSIDRTKIREFLDLDATDVDGMLQQSLRFDFRDYGRIIAIPEGQPTPPTASRTLVEIAADAEFVPSPLLPGINAAMAQASSFEPLDKPEPSQPITEATGAPEPHHPPVAEIAAEIEAQAPAWTPAADKPTPAPTPAPSTSPMKGRHKKH